MVIIFPYNMFTLLFPHNVKLFTSLVNSFIIPNLQYIINQMHTGRLSLFSLNLIYVSYNFSPLQMQDSLEASMTQ